MKYLTQSTDPEPQTLSQCPPFCIQMEVSQTGIFSFHVVSCLELEANLELDFQLFKSGDLHSSGYRAMKQDIGTCSLTLNPKP